MVFDVKSLSHLNEIVREIVVFTVGIFIDQLEKRRIKNCTSPSKIHKIVKNVIFRTVVLPLYFLQ